MCGITGFVNLQGHAIAESRARVQKMTDIIAHRGPDGDGVWVDAHCALGHRRLAIIDVSTGQQPMGTADGKVQICFNGEIYNFQEVRKELEALGHTFRTHSDTEVILLAYMQWGEQHVERLNGMFAYAIWDARVRRLMIARDRVGEKPLFYAHQGRTLAFGSELKALRAGGYCSKDIDPESLDCYLTLGYVPAPRCLYKGVRKLRPAHYLLLSDAGLVERPYWKLKLGAPKPRTLDEAVEEFEPILDEAVRCRLMSEVPLGAFLSGGIDSGLVVSSMAKLMGRPVITNSIGSPDPRYDELDLARMVAKHLGTEHHEHVVQPDAVKVLEKIAWHMDEPVADPSTVPTWYVCEMARKNVTVALSGDGGDEAFGGYTFRYWPHVVESRVRRAVPAALRAPVFGALGAVWPASPKLPQPLRLRTISRNLAVSDAVAYYQDLTPMKSDVRERLYTPEFTNELRGFTPYEVIHPYYVQSGGNDALARSQHADMHLYMSDDVLVKVDRMSMAHALEVRAPLLDPRVLEFASTLPAAMKLNGSTGKIVLRRLAERRLPPRLHLAAKRGFSIPIDQWMRGELKERASDLLRSDSFLLGRLAHAEVRKLLSDHEAGKRNHGALIWGLLLLKAGELLGGGMQG
jgi:asparagine synthase (glutamine-hydrolysing)